MSLSVSLPADRARVGTQRSLAGGLFALSALMLLVASTFYALLPLPLGLPSAASGHPAALAAALQVGPGPMARAGGLGFVADFLMVVGSLGLLRRRSVRESERATLGWLFVAVSVVIALLFDSMMAALLYPLARIGQGELFLAVKPWFDWLFAAGNIPFGIGGALLLVEEQRSTQPRLPRWAIAIGFAFVGLAVIGGVGFVTGSLVAPQLVGLPIFGGCLVFGALGAHVWQRGD